MFKNSYLKNVLTVLLVAFAGFILLNLTFLLYALSVTLADRFLPVDFGATHRWFGPLTLSIFIVIIALISWLVLKSKLNKIYKATYLTVPLAVVFMVIGIILYRWPVFAYGINALIFGAVLVYLYKTKKPWLYYYTVILIALVLLIFTLSGGQI